MPKCRSYAKARRAIILLFAALTIVGGAIGASSALAAPISDAALGGLVWGDRNGDGLANDGAGSGLAGVGIRVFVDDGDQAFEPNTADRFVSAVQTAADGRYRIALSAGSSYWVDVDESTLTAGLALTRGPEPALVIVSAKDELNIDFGYSPRGGVWGTVFYDRNLDGEHGMGEEGVSSVEVCLYRDLIKIGQLGAGDQFLSCAYTDSQGNYVFSSLLYGDYLVAESARPGVGHSTPSVRAIFLDPWLATGVEAAAIGDVLLADVSGDIYIDYNGNGRHDPNESLGVSAAPITAIHLVTGVAATVQSDNQGRYTISNLMPGAYRLEAPETHTSLILSSPATVMLSLGFGEQRVGQDFGYVAPTSVTLVSFVAERAGNGVRLSWTTGMELNQDGFVILRGAGPDKPFTAVSSLISASNDPEGASYQWVDTNAAAGTTFWYKLQSLPDGEIFGPVTVAGGARFQVFMPSLTR